jgi:hypothetical protein
MKPVALSPGGTDADDSQTLPIGLADLVRALHALVPGDEEASIIGRLLGLRGEHGSRTKGLPLQLTTRSPREPLAPWGEPEERSQNATTSGQTRMSSPRDWSTANVTLHHAPPHPPSGVGGLRAPIPIGEAEPFPFPLDPLFHPNGTRGVLSAALATASPAGTVDIDRLIESLARRYPLLELPRRPAPTLSRGVQVLVDTGEGMGLWRRDQEDILPCIRDVASESLTRIWYFQGNPRWVYADSPSDVVAYQPPTIGTPVLLISDLGIRAALSRGPLALRHFVDLGRALVRLGCPPVALVPYPKARWPKAVDRYMTLVHWDRRTSARAVSRLSLWRRPRR